MKYIAKFGIDGGMSQGFGLKYPDYFEEKYVINSNTEENAVKGILKEALRLSMNHLSNPETDLTVVTVLEIINPEGKTIDQKLYENNFADPHLSMKNNNFLLSTHMIEHLLYLTSKKTD